MAAPAAAAGLEFTTYPSVPPWPAELQHEDGWQRVAVEDRLLRNELILDHLQLVDGLLLSYLKPLRRLEKLV